MSESINNADMDLLELARRLALEGMPTQAVVAFEAGVSQSTVSRAMRGNIKSASKGARKLWHYTSKRVLLLSGNATSEAIVQASPRHVSRGNASTALGSTRQRAAPLPRQRIDGNLSGVLDGHDDAAEAALAGLRDYLADAFDPMLVIEQLAVLRRAQDPARRRKSFD
jgi:hypothetical protein